MMVAVLRVHCCDPRWDLLSAARHMKCAWLLSLALMRHHAGGPEFSYSSCMNQTERQGFMEGGFHFAPGNLTNPSGRDFEAQVCAASFHGSGGMCALVKLTCDAVVPAYLLQAMACTSCSVDACT